MHASQESKFVCRIHRCNLEADSLLKSGVLRGILHARVLIVRGTHAKAQYWSKCQIGFISLDNWRTESKAAKFSPLIVSLVN